MWTATFWKATAERAISTTAQAAVAAIGVTAAEGGSVGVHHIDWGLALSIAALAGILSILKAIGAGAVTGTPSIGHAEILDPWPLYAARARDDDGDGIPDVAD